MVFINSVCKSEDCNTCSDNRANYFYQNINSLSTYTATDMSYYTIIYQLISISVFTTI
nr:MAG TPA: hypothetical protein [Caudoviricetes sp.]